MRIIAGEHKGRVLLGPEGDVVTRPITDRVKTALFNILGKTVVDAVVVDLFSGTGSIGLEALSRGARLCCFAERDRSALERLRRNIEVMRLGGRSRVWPGDVFAILPARLGELEGPVDLAFVDPPYATSATWDWADADRRLLGPLAARLASGGEIVLRCQRKTPAPAALDQLCVRSRRDYGKMSLLFFQKKA